MAYGVINNINYSELEAEKYYSFPAKYKGDAKAETRHMIMNGEYTGSEKKDGFYCRIIKDEDDNIILQGRKKGVDGTYANKASYVPQLKCFFKRLPLGTCLLCEIYLPNERGSRNITKILGCLEEKALQRQEKEENKLHLYVFDVWCYDNKSYLKEKYEKRVQLIKEISESITSPYVEYAQFYSGPQLWNFLGEVLANGGEGVVITKNKSIPEPGKRTTRKTLKIKMEIEQTIDAFIDGKYKLSDRDYAGKTPLQEYPYWENDRTHEKVCVNKFKEFTSGEPWIPIKKQYYLGLASAVSVSVFRDGKPYHIAWISNLDDTVREDIIRKPDKVINKVVELSAMEIEKKDDTYSLRHGKIIRWRNDKDYTECDFSQLEN